MAYIPPNISNVDENNSSTTPLGISGVFTGTAVEIVKDAILFVNIYSDQASATDGLSIQQSSDGSNWDHSDVFTIPAAAGKKFSIIFQGHWSQCDAELLSTIPNSVTSDGRSTQRAGGRRLAQPAECLLR